MEIHVYLCANCQRRLPQETSFCPQCGHATNDAVPKSMADPPTAEFAAPYPPRTSWQLALVRPDGDQVVFPLSGDLKIGRSSENDLPLQDHQVSRFHAVIKKTADGFLLTDLGSTNGTFVNRKRVHAAVRLRIGDAIMIGQFRLMVQRDSINCGHCSRLVKSDYLYCPHCGESLTGLSAPKSPVIPADIEGLPTDPLESPVSPAETAAIPFQPPAEKTDSTPAPEFAEAQWAQTAAPTPAPAPERERAAAPTPAPAPERERAAAPTPAPAQPRQQALSPADLAPPRSPKQLQPTVAEPVETPRNLKTLQGCAVAFVAGLCLLAGLALAGYWLYTSGAF